MTNYRYNFFLFLFYSRNSNSLNLFFWFVPFAPCLVFSSLNFEETNEEKVYNYILKQLNLQIFYYKMSLCQGKLKNIETYILQLDKKKGREGWGFGLLIQYPPPKKKSSYCSKKPRDGHLSWQVGRQMNV